MTQQQSTKPAHPTFLTALFVWMKVGLLSFGGPAGQIALMHAELVEKRRWVSDSRFIHALNYCMLLPGPEAQQMAVYLGWLLHRVRGGIVAGALFVLPGALLMLGISYVYVYFGKVPVIEAIFYGLKAAVMAIVAGAVIRIGKKILKNKVMWLLAALSFISIFYFKVPFPLIIISALIIGFIGGRFFPRYFHLTPSHGGSGKANQEGEYVISDETSAHIPLPSLSGVLLHGSFWLICWLAPVIICLQWLGPDHVLTKQGIFFSKAALVTFGGAYSVLPYVAQQAVEVQGWLTATQMMDGLGLAETTPGPLILVLQFVGFLGGWNEAMDMAPWMMALIAAALTTWTTFMPGYLFIFIGAPFIEHSRGNADLFSALSSVTAAVVGVVLNLAVWFSWHVVVPVPGQLDLVPLMIALPLFFAMYKWKWDVIKIIGIGAVIGIAIYFFKIIG